MFHFLFINVSKAALPHQCVIVGHNGIVISSVVCQHWHLGSNTNSSSMPLFSKYYGGGVHQLHKVDTRDFSTRKW